MEGGFLRGSVPHRPLPESSFPTTSDAQQNALPSSTPSLKLQKLQEWRPQRHSNTLRCCFAEASTNHNGPACGFNRSGLKQEWNLAPAGGSLTLDPASALLLTVLSKQHTHLPLSNTYGPESDLRLQGPSASGRRQWKGKHSHPSLSVPSQRCQLNRGPKAHPQLLWSAAMLAKMPRMNTHARRTVSFSRAILCPGFVWTPACCGKGHVGSWGSPGDGGASPICGWPWGSGWRISSFQLSVPSSGMA